MELPHEKNKPDGKFGGGNGDYVHPYLINNAQQLADLAWLVNDGKTFEGDCFKLTADITLNDIEWDSDGTPKKLESLKRWHPIGGYGTFKNDYFKGRFNGGGHTISGLVLKVGEYDYTGLFGAVQDAQISNLTIANSYMYENRWVANYNGGMFIAYMMRSKLTNCHVKTSNINVIFTDTKPDPLDSYPAIGGIVGQGSTYGKTLKSCSFDGNIHILSGSYSGYVAGLMAQGAPILEDCTVSGTMRITLVKPRKDDVNVDLYCNGLCYEGEDIKNCMSTMNFVIDTDDNVEGGIHTVCKKLKLNGLCGEAENITQCAYNGKITLKTLSNFSNKSTIGTVGSVTNSMSNCAFYCQVDGKDAQQEYSYYKKTKITFCPFMQKQSGNVSKATVLYDNDFFSTPDENHLCMETPKIDTSSGNNFVGNVATLKDDNVLNRLNDQVAFSTVWGKVRGGEYDGCPMPIACGGTYYTDKFKGKGTEDDPYLIGSAADLRLLSEGVNNGTILTLGVYFALADDLDMTGTDNLTGIGSYKHSFYGTFDGRGHVISNIKLVDGLFDYMIGTVKNLGIVNPEVNISNFNYCRGVIACFLGINEKRQNRTGTISNCYVGGDVYLYGYGSDYSETTSFGAMCGEAYVGSVSNSYFKGRIIVNDTNGSLIFNIGGLVGSMQNEITLKDSYASYEVKNEGEKTPNLNNKNGLIGVRSYKNGNKTSVVDHCYFVCNQAENYDNGGPIPATDIVTKCSNDSEILKDYDFTDNSPWMKGAYRPVLRSVRHYEATAADGSDTKVLLDAIPMTDSNAPSNDILHIDGSNSLNDNLLWALPNLAVYNAADKSEYILNCTLNPTKPLNYNRKIGRDVEAVRVNMKYPLKIAESIIPDETGKKPARHYYLLCLPGTVKRDNLPDGSKLLICGKLYKEGSLDCLNAVEADSVTAGVPFIAYVPNVTVDDTVNIVMRSKLTTEPLKSLTVDGKTQEFDLIGTFKGEESVEDLLDNFVVDSNNELQLVTDSKSQKVYPFTSYLSSGAFVKIADYLLLDEVSNETDRIVENNDDGLKHKIMLRRTLGEGKWNTICLPFDMTADEVAATFGAATKVEELSSVETGTDGGCTLKFTSATDGMKAGVAYLIKPGNGGNNFSLADRTLSNALSPVEKDVNIDGTSATIAFCGTFGRKMLGLNGEEYFIQGNKILHVADGQQIAMNGFRAYITASDAAAKALAKARIVHGDGTVTGLTLMEADGSANGTQRVYNLQGMEHNVGGTQQRGVYIKGGRKYAK